MSFDMIDTHVPFVRSRLPNPFAIATDHQRTRQRATGGSERIRFLAPGFRCDRSAIEKPRRVDQMIARRDLGVRFRIFSWAATLLMRLPPQDLVADWPSAISLCRLVTGGL